MRDCHFTIVFLTVLEMTAAAGEFGISDSLVSASALRVDRDQMVGDWGIGHDGGLQISIPVTNKIIISDQMVEDVDSGHDGGWRSSFLWQRR